MRQKTSGLPPFPMLPYPLPLGPLGTPVVVKSPHFACGSIPFSRAVAAVFVRAEGAGYNLSHQSTEGCPGDASGKAELLGYIFLFNLHGALKIC